MNRHSEDNPGLANKKIGMLIFLSSEIMFFTGLLGAYMVLRNTAQTWPDVSSLLNFKFGIINTALLSLSSGLYIFNLKKMSAGMTDTLRSCWIGVLLLGLLFLGVQFAEYRELWTVKHIYLSNGLFGAWFYILTALHGLHLLTGILCLAWFLTVSKPVSTFEALGLYWHFVYAVWLVLFLTLYVIA